MCFVDIILVRNKDWKKKRFTRARETWGETHRTRAEIAEISGAIAKSDEELRIVTTESLIVI